MKENEVKLSVIIPCLNQEHYIRATLESVCSQVGPQVEIIVIDGGSTDGTLREIENFRSSLSCIVSEPDKGHYDAVNKGMSRATGDILCWLNADDLYLPWTFSVVMQIFREHPEVCWLSGIPSVWDEDGRLVSVAESLPAYGRRMLAAGEHDVSLGVPGVQQESCFWRRSLWEKIGSKINTGFDLAGDHDLWARMARHADLVSVDTVLAGQRRHRNQRSSVGKDRYYQQAAEVRALHGGRTWLRPLMRRAASGCTKRFLARLLFRGTGPVLIKTCWEGWELQSRNIVR